MVTPAELASWQPTRLTAIADDLAAHRRSLMYLDDDLSAGKPPPSWTFADAAVAATDHARLSSALATQTSEIALVITALDEAAAAITSARGRLEGAMRLAGSRGLSVNLDTGAVRSVLTHDDEGERAAAQRLANGVAQDIDDALTAAAAADSDLAVALSRAHATDVNTQGSLAQQQDIHEFTGLDDAGQARYLLDHPELAGRLLDHATPEAREQLGEHLAGEIEAAAKDPLLLNDPSVVERYAVLLAAYGGDSVVMAGMCTQLGPAGVLASFNAIASTLDFSSDRAGVESLAAGLRDGLATASHAPGFNARQFGEDLTRYATWQITGDERDALEDVYSTTGFRNASTLSYLLRGEGYSDGFVLGAAYELDAFERADPQMNQAWYGWAGGGPLDSLGHSDGGFRPSDPMASLMGQLGQHPGLGLEFFADDARSEYYLTERDWRGDGFEGISRAALGIGTDPQNLANASRDTGMFVSEFVAGLAANDNFSAERAVFGSDELGQLLKHYMPGVSRAVSDPTQLVEPGVWDFTADHLAPIRNHPMFDTSDITELIRAAVATDAGTASLAEGIGVLQQAQVNNFAMAANGSPLNGVDLSDSLGGELAAIYTESALLQGIVQNEIGDAAIGAARSADQQVAAFADLVSAAAGMVPLPGSGLAGEVIGYGVSEAIQLGHDAITGAYGSNEASAILDADLGAGEVRNTMQISTFLSLVEAGLVEVPEDIRENWYGPNGELRTLTDIPLENRGVMAHEASRGVDDVLSPDILDLVFEAQFRAYHE